MRFLFLQRNERIECAHMSAHISVNGAAFFCSPTNFRPTHNCQRSASLISSALMFRLGPGRWRSDTMRTCALRQLPACTMRGARASAPFMIAALALAVEIQFRRTRCFGPIIVDAVHYTRRRLGAGAAARRSCNLCFHNIFIIR